MTASPAMPVFGHGRRAPRLWARALAAGLMAAVVVSAGGCRWARTVLVDPATNARTLSETAQAAQESGDRDRARRLLEQAHRADPANPDVSRQLARVLLDAGDSEAALDTLNESLAHNSDDVRGRMLLADLLVECGNLGHASVVLDEALAVDPHLLEALLLKGRIAELQQQDGLALECYHRVMGADPENIVARLRIAELQIKAERPDRAAPILRSICQSSHASCDQLAAARWQLGIAYGRERRWDEAAAELTAAIQNRPASNADDWYRIAYAYRMAGNDAVAASHLQRALELDPAHPSALALSAALSPTHRLESGTAIQPARFVLAGAPPPAGW